MTKPVDSDIEHLWISGHFVFSEANNSVLIIVDLSARRAFRCVNLLPDYGEIFTQKDGRLDFSRHDSGALGDARRWGSFVTRRLLEGMGGEEIMRREKRQRGLGEVPRSVFAADLEACFIISATVIGRLFHMPTIEW